jgi:hypothetical protein
MAVPRKRSRSYVSLAAAGLLAAGGLALAACSNSPSTPSSSATTTSSTVSVGGSTSAPTSSTSSTTTSTTSATPQNLPATPAIKGALTAAYVAHNGLPATEVAGTAPNSVYYGFEPSTNTYWAIAGFVPTANASMQTQVAMQDEGCCGVFSMTTGGSWKYVAPYQGGGTPCPGQVPADLWNLWHLVASGMCSTATTTTTS